MAVERRVRTTIALSQNLLDSVDREVREGYAVSRNELFIESLENELDRRENARIDAEIALMADDPEEMAEIAQITREFEVADWEAWQASGEPPYPYGEADTPMARSE